MLALRFERVQRLRNEPISTKVIRLITSIKPPRINLIQSLMFWAFYEHSIALHGYSLV